MYRQTNLKPTTLAFSQRGIPKYFPLLDHFWVGPLVSTTVSQHRIIRKPLLKSSDGSCSDHKWEDIRGVLRHPLTCCLPRTVRTRKALVSRQEACFWYCAWLLHFDVYSLPRDYFMHCMQWLSRTRRKSGLGWGAEGLQGKCLSLHFERNQAWTLNKCLVIHLQGVF